MTSWPGQGGKIIRRRIFSSLQWINYKPGQWRGIKETPSNFVVSSLRSSDTIHCGPRLELRGFCSLFWCLLTSQTCNNLHAYYPGSGDFLSWLSSPWRDNRYVLRILYYPAFEMWEWLMSVITVAPVRSAISTGSTRSLIWNCIRRWTVWTCPLKLRTAAGCDGLVMS